MQRKPLLIAFEGIDGSGKFTQASLLKKWLEEKTGKPVGVWAEPNDSSLIGKTIRAYLNKKTSFKIEPLEFQRMFVLDRAHNIFSFLHHNQEGHDFKIADRYALSTIAFGMLSGRPAEDFIKLHNDVIGPSMVWPNLTIILDISPETSISRIKARVPGFKEGIIAADINENKSVQEKVRGHYLEIAKREDLGKTVVVNGERPPEDVFEDVKKVVAKHFALPA
ncbi:dTMP kinase [Candidatus Giovannonibacteria bacterium RIFCSPLOWO2_02_FULL_45_14]|uniref:Thymidylate kinase n=1 Tax=Candidatus Giovannonibacteria bacterium RIFCSPLOWO2_12_FULL_44_15 TaxID=1798364 RepID=A0A1F5Y0U3_9BACT|nr:MAG: dTMP kinase [Candidatus Giovannonibacteria bacterium RIFCSPHIGHO2_02_FULL_44_31]OGF76400.1 MAG: dTMP kinase [Candidatus Giovannonibacteria bacterium RIFCSPHIGHO2_12_FULL_44_29]OGF91072.1 MAG: dTMP kinase [Candidatus Giovannonibacteria bacterium RIFCSPLOWO2_02_FULL_45_14]OGF93769.1 MAG: dTMP kinase [Candidatus Giovannonibacteria bacterium RIFCSPLOWO2_12_FULL_44_15]